MAITERPGSKRDMSGRKVKIQTKLHFTFTIDKVWYTSDCTHRFTWETRRTRVTFLSLLIIKQKVMWLHNKFWSQSHNLKLGCFGEKVYVAVIKMMMSERMLITSCSGTSPSTPQATILRGQLSKEHLTLFHYNIFFRCNNQGLWAKRLCNNDKFNNSEPYKTLISSNGWLTLNKSLTSYTSEQCPF